MRLFIAKKFHKTYKKLIFALKIKVLMKKLAHRIKAYLIFTSQRDIVEASTYSLCIIFIFTFVIRLVLN